MIPHLQLTTCRCACFDCTSEASILDAYVREVGLGHFKDPMDIIKDAKNGTRMFVWGVIFWWIFVGSGGGDLIRRNGRFIKEAAAYLNLRDF